MVQSPDSMAAPPGSGSHVPFNTQEFDMAKIPTHVLQALLQKRAQDEKTKEATTKPSTATPKAWSVPPAEETGTSSSAMPTPAESFIQKSSPVKAATPQPATGTRKKNRFATVQEFTPQELQRFLTPVAPEPHAIPDIVDMGNCTAPVAYLIKCLMMTPEIANMIKARQFGEKVLDYMGKHDYGFQDFIDPNLVSKYKIEAQEKQLRTSPNERNEVYLNWCLGLSCGCRPTGETSGSAIVGFDPLNILCSMCFFERRGVFPVSEDYCEVIKKVFKQKKICMFPCKNGRMAFCTNCCGS